MSRQPTVIYSAANTQQAHLLQGLLRNQGIAAWVVNDAIQLGGGELPLGWTAAARVVVAEEDSLKARRLAEAFDRQTAHEPLDDEPPDDAVTSQWTDWPSCPVCGERRTARCPACGANSAAFPLADIEDEGLAPRVFLICTDCNDHFLPHWYRLCPRCGHDYEDGIEAAQSQRAAIEFSRREWVVLGLIGAGIAILVAYFVWLFGWRTG
jgi:DNA-directed RNA polymerase subunit M/transcription elongation factor TFIIS